jgi:hypothetical protein
MEDEIPVFFLPNLHPATESIYWLTGSGTKKRNKDDNFH